MTIDHTSLRRPDPLIPIDVLTWAFLMGASLADQFDHGSGDQELSEDAFMEDLVESYNINFGQVRRCIGRWQRRVEDNHVEDTSFLGQAVLRASQIDSLSQPA